MLRVCKQCLRSFVVCFRKMGLNRRQKKRVAATVTLCLLCKRARSGKNCNIWCHQRIANHDRPVAYELRRNEVTRIERRCQLYRLHFGNDVLMVACGHCHCGGLA